ncbi:MAG TPA: hypothetical protein VNG12_08285 [Acidimicrobiales bacterium]|nr:hypothetical protein [Acidimicrobiales bacterium]
MRSQKALLACSGVALILVVLVPVSPPAASGRNPVRIGLFGDSLSVQAAPYFNLLLQAGGKATVNDFVYGGTAACDWLPQMRRYARTEHPRAVIFEFVGNTFSSCMKGCQSGSPAAVDLYCSAISSAIQVFLGLGTHVFLIGAPIMRSQWIAHDADWNALNKAFAALAAKHPDRVTYMDAGRAVEGPHQAFVSTLPCLFFEPCLGPTVAGVRTNVVRSPDGVHFCPGRNGNARGQVSRCDEYSSGAFRFAAAMAGPVIRKFGLARTGGNESRTG